MIRLMLTAGVTALALSTAGVAAPLRIVVPGGAAVPDPNTYWPGYEYISPESRDIINNDYWTPERLGGPFDPGRAARYAEEIAHPRASRKVPWNGILAGTLIRNQESIADHWIACQAAYGSYDLVTDTYTSRNGLPQPCLK